VKTPYGRPLVLVLAALLALTLISWAVSHLHLGWASVVIALGIAVIKASVVLYWFMELPHVSTPARIAVIVTLSFIALLCAGTVADVALR
jgi:cytochrome c oxidase subunit 4